MKETSKTIRTFSYEEKTEQMCVLRVSAKVLGSYSVNIEVETLVDKFMIRYPEYRGCLYNWEYSEDKTLIVITLYTTVLDFEELF